MRLSARLFPLLCLLLPCAAAAQSPSTVLVVANGASKESVSLARYYMAKRHVPAGNLLLIPWSPEEKADNCDTAFYTREIETPVYEKISKLKQIDYIVICRNLPTTIKETGGSVDSALAARTTKQTANPYYLATQPFSAAKYRMRLVTRLDGWSWADARALVDHSLAAKRGNLFLLDIDPGRAGNGYGLYNEMMRRAARLLQTNHLTAELDETTNFVTSDKPLAGYVSWGSNDGHFSAANYEKLRFLPGAIAETAVSTSGRFLRYPGQGQSQSAVLIHNGVTGIKGYVTEPYLAAIAHPDILFSLYTTGSNLAESFYAASLVIGWKDVVIGDPLCRPYK